MQSLNVQYNPRIDQLRWLAATVVFLFHFHLEYKGLGGPALDGPWTALVTEGHTGVGLFFALSGFQLMYIALFQREIAYRDFMRNRVLRIFPLFLTVFLIATSIGRDKFQPQDLLYVFASNLGMAPTSLTVITGAAWTISIEFMFYLVFPFLARFAMERNARYLVDMLVLMVFFKIAAYTVNDNSTLMYFSTFVGRFDQFLIGMMAAMVYQRYRLALNRQAPLMLAVSTAVVLLDTAMLHHIAPFAASPRSPFWICWSIIEALGWAAFILSWVSFKPRMPDWLERGLCHGGKISYSFYLLHMALLHILAEKVGLASITGVAWIDAAILLALAYGVTWMLSTLSYNTIEEPFLHLRRNYGSVRPAVVQPARAA